ncbi:MAG: hypothetical protein ACI4A8_04725 [Muribaculaceae bacterium]
MNNLIKRMWLAATISAITISSSATNFFVKSDAPSGNNGSSWENALCFSDFLADIASADGTIANGDAVHFAAGTYLVNETTGITLKNKWVSLIGGYPDNLSGNETPEIVYPSATPSVLSADINGNGTADEGDARNLFFIQTTKDNLSASARTILIKGFSLIGGYYAGTKGTEVGAICADMTNDVVVKNCLFSGYVSVNGGGAYSNSGSKTYFSDCVFSDNTAGDAGAAIRLTKRGDAAKVFDASVTLDRCAIVNNHITKQSGAGGSAIRHTAGNLYIINSTIANNSAYAKAAIDVSDNVKVNILSSTIANNSVELPETGSAIHAVGTPEIYTTNSYILACANAADAPAITIEAMTQKVSNSIKTDGANIIGLCSFSGADGFVDDSNSIWTNDNYSADNTAEAKLGNCQLTEVNGTKVIAPLAEEGTYDTETVGYCTFNSPFTVDKTLDQTGAQRRATGFTNPGAYDIVLGPQSGCVSPKASQGHIATLGNGLYRISFSEFKVFNISGRLVVSGRGDCIDLSDMPRGLYIVNTPTANTKVIR